MILSYIARRSDWLCGWILYDLCGAYRHAVRSAGAALFGYAIKESYEIIKHTNQKKTKKNRTKNKQVKQNLKLKQTKNKQKNKTKQNKQKKKQKQKTTRT